MRFLSNIDGAAFDDAVKPLDAATTLVVVASKTFSTLETLANLDAARAWLRAAGVDDPDGRMIAVTANPEAAVEQGIDETRILRSAKASAAAIRCGARSALSAALALGWDAFEALLEGAAEMDRHFRFAEPRENVPLIAAFADRLYVEKLGCQTRGVFAYDERLRLLPFYLQQLEMESNGKSVTSDGQAGRASDRAGDLGRHRDRRAACGLPAASPGDGAHAGRIRRGGGRGGRPGPRAPSPASAQCLRPGRGADAGAGERRPATHYPGNRPSTTILLDRLDPRSLGALIAFYEHRTFANAVLLGINPFDQFGVELGKDIARQLSEGTGSDGLDASTRALIERAGL